MSKEGDLISIGLGEAGVRKGQEMKDAGKQGDEDMDRKDVDDVESINGVAWKMTKR